jgi:hypothetical protein
MITNKDIFNINKVAIPFTKQELEGVIGQTVINGYVSTTYDMMIQTLEDISRAKEYPVILNPNEIFSSSNNPLIRNDVLIRVEGMQTYSEFINTVVQDGEDYAWTNFITYSEMFKDEIKQVKTLAYKKFLWNYHNIDTWFSENNIGLLDSDKNMLVTDFQLFKERVLYSEDFKTFIDCCKTDDIANAVRYIIKKGCALLKKYKVELNNHISTDNKRQTNIILKNPIITKIFLQSGAAGRCKKDWPKIRFTTLDKKSFDTIGIWEV